MLRFTDKGKTDKKLQSEVFKTVKTIRAEGLPNTMEGLHNLYNLYNIMFGQTKKPNNCIYCRKTLFESLEKAVLLLEIKPKKATKSQSKKITSPKKKTTKKTAK